LSIILTLITANNLAIQFSFLIIAPLIHYFVYDVKNKQDYYFYYNLGLSSTVLWCTTIGIGIINFIVITII
jgi:hypothetical protein